MGLMSWLKDKFSKKKDSKTNEKLSEETEVSSEKDLNSLDKEMSEEELNDIYSSLLKDDEPSTEVKQERDKKGNLKDKHGLTKKEREKLKLKEQEENLKAKRKEIAAKKREEKEKEKEYLKTVDDKYITGLDKSRANFTSRLKKLSAEHREANSMYFDGLERILVEADVGIKLTMELLDQVEKECNIKGIKDTEVINDLLVDKMFTSYLNQGGSFATDINFCETNPTVVMMVGVNGTGKTTTIAKLAKRYKERGKKILLIAADTFRAGAINQLKVWADRLEVDIYHKEEGADAASVCYEGLTLALKGNYDLVFIDTAGRLHNKSYLMDELGKVVRVIKKVVPSAPHETLLVLDANTGQNGIEQAKVFKEVTNISGVIITKMDGTSKGGIILAIRDNLQVPVRFIGLGEQMDDLKEFDLDQYLYGLLIGKGEN